MKRRLLLILSIFFLFFVIVPKCSFGQETKKKKQLIENNQNEGEIEHSQNSAQTLAYVLDQIAKKFNYYLVYDAKLIKNTNLKEKIEIPNKNSKINILKFLEELLLSHTLSYRIFGDTIIIKPLEKLTQYNNENNNGYFFHLKDSQTKENIDTAYVDILGKIAGISSNFDGYFFIPKQKENTYIAIKHLGYKTSYVLLDTLRNQEQTIINLQPKEIILNNVVYTSYRQRKIFEFFQNHRSIQISPSQLDAVPTLGAKDFMRTIQMLPGVSPVGEGSNGLSVRGLGSQFNLLLLDGMMLYGVDHFFGVFSALNTKMIKNVQVFKNSSESKYGGNIAAVVDIQGKNGSRRKNTFGGGINLISSDFFSEVKILKNLNLIFAFRRSFTDLFTNNYYDRIFKQSINNNFQKRNTLNFDLPDISPSYSFFDTNLKLTWYPSDKHIISFTAYNGDDAIDLTANNTDNNKYYQFTQSDSWGSFAVGLNWGYVVNKKWYSLLSSYFSGYYITKFNKENLLNFDDFNNILEENSIENSNNLFTFGFKWSNEYQMNENSNFEWGLSSITHGTRNEINNIVDNSYKQNFLQNGTILAVYFQWNAIWFNKLHIYQGIRTQYHYLSDTITLEPKIKVVHHLNPWLNTRIGFVLNNQFVNSVDLDPFDELNPRNFYISDNNNIPIIRSNVPMWGLQIKKNDWTIDLEVYYQYISGISIFIPNFSANYPQPFFNGNSETFGIDFIIRKEINNLNSWISYSFMESSNKFATLSNGKNFRPTEYLPHQFQWSNVYKFKKFLFSMVFTSTSGKSYSIPLSIQNKHLSNAEINSASTPIYHRLDFSFFKNINLGKRGKGEFGINIYNIYNQYNIKYRQYTRGISDNQNIPTINNIYYLGITPNIFFNFQF